MHLPRSARPARSRRPLRRRVTVIAVALAVALPASLAAGASASASTTVDPQPSAAARVIVKYRSGTSEGNKLRSLSVRGLRQRERLPITGASVVDVPKGTSAATTAAALRRDPNVAYAVPDVQRHLSGADPYFPYQWGLANSGQTLPAAAAAPKAVAGVDVGGKAAWAIQRGLPDVTVAVIDEGIQITHPDLRGAIWTNPGEIPGNGKDDDGDGYVDDVHGWNFISNSPTVYSAADGDDHGTHVGGIVGATADNGQGVAGLASGVRIMPLKFLTATGGGYDSDAIRAIGYAVAHGAKVINASWGASIAQDPAANSPALRDAIASCGCVFVTAAGNDGANMDDPALASYPAAFGLPNMLSVAAVDDTGALAGFSNYGSTVVDLAAPGQGVISTLPDGYGWGDGTSMATPFVAAAAALMYSVVPSLAPQDVVQRLRADVKPLTSLSGKVITGGMLDAGAVLTRLDADLAAPRLAGLDRYATAAAVAGEFPSGVATVYVASGEGYADALAAAARAGGQQEPVLLTKPRSLPKATTDALIRLAPQRIVVMGGNASVSPDVAAQLAAYTAGGVTRLAGPDRYATAAAVAGEYAPGVDTVYVASGQGFADALAGAALAGSQKAPVLLTSPGVLPAATANALTRLQPKRIVVLGGVGSVSAPVATQLATYTQGPVERLAGADRYATAAAVADQFPAGAPAAFLTSGAGFADALAGAALAASRPGPVLLTTRDSIPSVTKTALGRLMPTSVTVLGGRGVVSSRVAVVVKAL